MKNHLRTFQQFLKEVEDPTYYQETFYFTVLLAMTKGKGGSRDETKNDIRALGEVLTVTLVEAVDGGIQRDIGSKYLSTLKVHVRKPKDFNKEALMKQIALTINSFKGCSVLRYKEKKSKPRRKAFHGAYKIDELDYQKVRRQKAGSHRKMKKRLIGSGGNRNTGGGKGWTRPSMKRGKNAPVGYGAMEEEAPLEEDILVQVGDETESLLAFDLQDTLNQKVWDHDIRVRPGVKGALMEIVDEFMEGLELEIDVKDVVVTGSLANYNWSKFSDIDLHILVDFGEINENEAMVKKFFDAVRSRWNKVHDIYVKGHEVEIYVQDEHEPHTSTGVYSLKDDRWVIKPKKIKPEMDKTTADKKMRSIVKELDKLESLYNNKKYEQSLDTAQRVKDKISNMRQSGLQKTGIYSAENLAFKMLRRAGDIERLFNLYTRSYDKVYSLDQ
jgi:predicted nucleotidyltransferase